METQNTLEYSSITCEICMDHGFYFIDSFNPDSLHGHDEIKINCECQL